MRTTTQRVKAQRRTFPILEQLEDRTLLAGSVTTVATPLATTSERTTANLQSAAVTRTLLPNAAATALVGGVQVTFLTTAFAGSQFAGSLGQLVSFSALATTNVTTSSTSADAMMNGGETAQATAAVNSAAETQNTVSSSPGTDSFQTARLQALLLLATRSTPAVVFIETAANNAANMRSTSGVVPATPTVTANTQSALTLNTTDFSTGPRNAGNDSPNFPFQDLTRPGVPNDATLRLLLGSPVAQALSQDGLFRREPGAFISPKDPLVEMFAGKGSEAQAPVGAPTKANSSADEVWTADGPPIRADGMVSVEAARRVKEQAAVPEWAAPKLTPIAGDLLDSRGSVDLPALRQRVEQYMSYLATQPEELLSNGATQAWVLGMFAAGVVLGEFWRQTRTAAVEERATDPRFVALDPAARA